MPKFPLVKAFMTRHRTNLTLACILGALLLVTVYLAFELEFFAHPGQISNAQRVIDLDEILVLSGLLTLGLLIMSIRLYVEQRHETRRRILAEQHVRDLAFRGELAFRDCLTGLPNRRQFDHALRAALDSPPAAGAVHALLLLDLNGFKQINDVHGHVTGDEVLTIVAQRLLGVMRNGDLLARLGGDEFGILALHLLGPEAATSIALRINEALRSPITTGALTHQVGTGIGISLLHVDADTPVQALRKADLALYRAKEERRSAFRFFEDAMDRRVHERQWLETELRLAVVNGSIQPFFQPSVQLSTRRILGFEAVPRWFHPTAGEIPAERFLPVAEESGLIHELAEHILRSACATAASWPGELSLSLDLLPGQLHDPGLTTRILSALRASGLPARRLEIEITESTLVRDLEAARTTLGALREHGVRIALDKFGTGYSSLYHLRNFRLDKIKIDSSFIHGMMSGKQDAAIVRALIGLAHGLGITVAADGIEDPAQQASLVQTGCEHGQGHLFSESMPAAETLRLLSTQLPRAA
jgi:diguanylate cyclase (GGDEF)-like protein